MWSLVWIILLKHSAEYWTCCWLQGDCSYTVNLALVTPVISTEMPSSLRGVSYFFIFKEKSSCVRTVIRGFLIKLEFLRKALPSTKWIRMFGLALLDPQDEGTKILLNIKRYSLHDTASQPTRLESYWHKFSWKSVEKFLNCYWRTHWHAKLIGAFLEIFVAKMKRK
jgi:hypothetical protein